MGSVDEFGTINHLIELGCAGCFLVLHCVHLGLGLGTPVQSMAALLKAICYMQFPQRLCDLYSSTLLGDGAPIPDYF